LLQNQAIRKRNGSLERGIRAAAVGPRCFRIGNRG
jgi:hypothetical protein